MLFVYVFSERKRIQMLLDMNKQESNLHFQTVNVRKSCNNIPLLAIVLWEFVKTHPVHWWANCAVIHAGQPNYLRWYETMKTLLY